MQPYLSCPLQLRSHSEYRGEYSFRRIETSLVRQTCFVPVYYTNSKITFWVLSGFLQCNNHWNWRSWLQETPEFSGTISDRTGQGVWSYFLKYIRTSLTPTTMRHCAFVIIKFMFCSWTSWLQSGLISFLGVTHSSAILCPAIKKFQVILTVIISVETAILC